MYQHLSHPARLTVPKHTPWLPGLGLLVAALALDAPGHGAGLLLGTAHAQPTPGASGPGVVRHAIQKGDTLEQLSRRYLGDPTLWPAVRAHNGNVHPLRLSPGQVLEIPLQLLRTAAASVDYVHGTASLSRPGSSTQGVTRGQPLQEGDTLRLEPEAYVTVRLADGSSVRVQTNSQVTLQQLRRRGRAGSLQTVIDLQEGGMAVQTAGPPDSTRRLEVITPVAATSVRGTHFDVYTTTQRTSTAVQSGLVAMQPHQHPEHSQLLHADYGMALSSDSPQARPTPMLPAIAADSLPQRVEDAHWLDLRFAPQPGASAYQLHIAHDAAGDAVIYQARLEQPQARFSTLPDGQYWLQLRPIDAQGIPGHPTQVPLTIKAHPVAPLPQHPAPEAVAPQGSTQLQCTPVDTASGYVLQVAALAPEQPTSAADFSQPLLQVQDSPQCQLDLSSLPSGHYAWRSASVRHLDGQRDQGPYSANTRFRLEPPPAQPTADDLAVNSQNGITRLYWPGEAGQRYHLQALASPDSTQPALALWLDEPQWQVGQLPPGTWHIRFQIEDASGLLSAFSPTRSVQVLPLVLDGSGQPVGTGAGLGLRLAD